jgi:membrane-bound lytic murein transglycosylase D
MAGVAKWGGLGAVLVGLGFLAAAGSTAPAVVKDVSALPRASGSNAYSLTALHRRLPPQALDTVQRYVDFFSTKQRRRVEDGLARSGRYLETYRQIFRAEGVPEELVFLPMIESGFVENAVSPAKAVGVWQFISETGKLYNLQNDDWYDRRLDPIVSARAAARLLRHLYNTFDDWDLALAAYNSGAGTVKWARRVNEKAKLPTSYWALDLPEETRNYVPAFIAMVLIAKNPSAFGFDEIQFHAKVVFDQIKVSPGVSLADLAESLGIGLDRLLDLNPELIRGEIPPGEKPYSLRIPSGARRPLLTRLLGVKDAGCDCVIHSVQAADTVDALASQFKVRPANIQKANQLKDDLDLTQRRVVVIPL